MSTNNLRVQQLEKICSALRRDNLVLVMENQTMKTMYQMTVNRVLALANGTGALGPRVFVLTLNDAAPLDRGNYKHVQWWDISDWTNLKKAQAASKGINVSLLYVQMEDGVVITGWHASNIFDYARQLFTELGCHGLAPLTWQQGAWDVQQHFYAEMGLKFPELCLCSNNWKARHLVTNMYSGWRSSYLKQAGDAELESDSKPGKRSKVDNGSDIDKWEIEDPIIYTINLEDTDWNAEAEIVRTTLSQTPLEPQENIAPPRIPIKIVNPLYYSPEPECGASKPVLSVLPTIPIAGTVVTTQAAKGLVAPPGVIPVEQISMIVPLPTDLHAIPSSLDTPLSVLGQDHLTIPVAQSFVPGPRVVNVDVPGATATVQLGSAAAAPLSSPAADTSTCLPTIPKARKESKMATTKSKTARNLCAIEWCHKHPGGSRSQFKMYWDGLKDTPDAKLCADRANLATAAQTKAAS
ncbi:hypothetical protein B0H10DRAFT_1954556 [Mycena sp. CBHHK59/15]|nr:hypothetical protein B0H10DRAFT_1954556 [Mycena sp. CBHHK59/15]